jgi:dTDP-4-dehydrorhamnose 3,5-epimerase
MQVLETSINDVKLIKPTLYGDKRGFFFETFRHDWFKNNVCDVTFIQDNHSKSSRGILRGLHYQINNPQGKLVRVISGEVYDVAVDMRRSSSTFGQSFGTYLSSSNHHQLWVPAGFAHGFYVLSEFAEFVYKCTDYYSPDFERTLIWSDEHINVEWPLLNNTSPNLSNKDQKGVLFKNAEYFE